MQTIKKVTVCTLISSSQITTDLLFPLVTGQYHEVQFQAAFESAEKLCAEAVIVKLMLVLDVVLLINYAYLDTAERKEFAKNTHEMLIEQVQVPGEDTINETQKD